MDLEQALLLAIWSLLRSLVALTEPLSGTGLIYLEQLLTTLETVSQRKKEAVASLLLKKTNVNKLLLRIATLLSLLFSKT